MRRLLFGAVAQTIGLQILFISWISDTSRRILGSVGYFLMNIIDPTLLKTYTSVLEQQDESNELESQQLELKLLTSAAQVRDHAKETGDWTDKHSDAINAIGEALVTQLNWEEESVHQYLREVVESIDGLEYGLEEW